MRAWAGGCAAVACFAVLGGCAVATPQSVPPPPAVSVSIAGVPFFPQERYQCGPAALATLLVHSGVVTDASALVDAVYLPGRGGSLQPELLAATRRAGRIALTLPPAQGALTESLAAGYPALVLQNLGTSWWPRWHYAVVTGYDAERGGWVLRSGRTRDRFEAHARFIRRWRGGGFWAMVAAPPGRLPTAIDASQIARALAAAEPYLAPAAALAAWEELAGRELRGPLLQFALGNARRRMDDAAGAARAYLAALALAPGDAAVRNNYADLLLEARCVAAARRLPEPLGRAFADVAVAEALAATTAAIDASGPGLDACPLPVPGPKPGSAGPGGTIRQGAGA